MSKSAENEKKRKAGGGSAVGLGARSSRRKLSLHSITRRRVHVHEKAATNPVPLSAVGSRLAPVASAHTAPAGSLAEGPKPDRLPPLS